MNKKCIDLNYTNESVYDIGQSLHVFDLKVLSQILDTSADGDQNLIFSSHSLASVLSMLTLGADGDTFTELSSLLTLPCGKNATASENLYLGAFKQSLEGLKANADVALESANNVYIDNHYSLSPVFEQKCSQYFESQPEKVDFVNKAEEVRTRINQWVENKTRNKITDLLPSGSVSSSTKIVLVNAVYFKGTYSFWSF